MWRISPTSTLYWVRVCACVYQLTKSTGALTFRLHFVQASLPVHNQVLPSIEGVDGSDPLATLQNPLGRLEAKEEEDEDEDEDTEEDEEEDGEDTDLDDWEPDPPRPFDPHDLCKWSWPCERVRARGPGTRLLSAEGFLCADSGLCALLVPACPGGPDALQGDPILPKEERRSEAARQPAPCHPGVNGGSGSEPKSLTPVPALSNR